METWSKLASKVGWFTIGDPSWLVNMFESEPLPSKQISVGSYPDGEFRIALPTEASEITIIAASPYCPIASTLDNLILLQADIACVAAKQHGAHTVAMLLSEIPYLRQDRPTPGSKEAAAISWILSFLERSAADVFFTLHPKTSIFGMLSEQTVFSPSCEEIAEALNSALIAKKLKISLVVAPDKGSEDNVAIVAKNLNARWFSIAKQRIGPEDVKIASPVQTLQSESIVIFDDMLVSGATIDKTARCLKNAANIICCYVSNFRPTKVGWSRLAKLIDEGVIEYIFTGSFHRFSELGERLVPVNLTMPMQRCIIRGFTAYNSALHTQAPSPNK